MYPVISTLRRLAANVVYLNEPVISTDKRRHVVKVQKEVTHLDLDTGWQRSRTVGLYRLRSTGPTASSRAVGLTRYENSLVERFKLLRTDYTLLLGPEREDCPYGAAEHIAHVGVVLGLHRLNGTLLTPKRNEKRLRVRLGDLPPGVVPQRR